MRRLAGRWLLGLLLLAAALAGGCTSQQREGIGRLQYMERVTTEGSPGYYSEP